MQKAERSAAFSLLIFPLVWHHRKCGIPSTSITLRFCWIHFSHASDEQCFWFFSRRSPKRHLILFVQPFLQLTANESFVPQVIGMRNLSHHAFSGDTIMAGCFRYHIAHGQPLIGHLKVQLQPIVPLLFGSAIPDVGDLLKPFDAMHSCGMAQRERQAVDEGIGMMLAAFCSRRRSI